MRLASSVNCEKSGNKKASTVAFDVAGDNVMAGVFVMSFTVLTIAWQGYAPPFGYEERPPCEGLLVFNELKTV